jgi:hypothetical protein
MSISTFNALIARGVDSNKANQLLSIGHNLTTLKQLSVEDLRKLNLRDTFIETIQKENRPPIPPETVITLLYKSKRTCCICRDNSRSIIIHHIEEWHISKDHSENNLVVLCLQHHDEAHTQKDLSQNLSKSQLLAFKEKWISYVQTDDAKVVLGLMQYYSRWDYINIKRVFELFINQRIMYNDIESYLTLLNLNILDQRGIPHPIQEWKIPEKPEWHLCDFGSGIYYMHYLKTIIERIVEKLPLIDLTNNLSISFIKSIVNPGSIITAQLGFYFSDIDKFERSQQQLRKAHYKGNSIKIEFVFNAWECTSSSGRFDALSGHKVAVPILFVRSVLEDEENNLVISGSCLAIGTWFENHRQKDDIAISNENID